MKLPRDPGLPDPSAPAFRTRLYELFRGIAQAVNINANQVGDGTLNTDATQGFAYLPTCAGAPTGVPETRVGYVAMVYDTTNNKLYAYNGAWKSVTLA